MIILIAGGTGFIGQALIAHFLSSHHQIIVLSRDQTKVKRIFGQAVQAMTWEQLSIDVIKNLDVIINLSGSNIGERRWTLQRQQEIIDSRVLPTKRLTDFCAQLAVKAPVFVNASAIGVYDFIPPTEFAKIIYDEDSCVAFNAAPHFLARVAREWEMATWLARDKGVRVINTRFGVVLGSQGGMLKKLLPTFKLGLGAKIGSGLQPLAWVSLRDVVRAISFVLNTPALHGPVNIVSPQVVSQVEFADTLAAVLNRPRLLALPDCVIRCLFGVMGEELLLQGVAVKPARLLAQGFEFVDADLRSSLIRMNVSFTK